MFRSDGEASELLAYARKIEQQMDCVVIYDRAICVQSIENIRSEH